MKPFGVQLSFNYLSDRKVVLLEVRGTYAPGDRAAVMKESMARLERHKSKRLLVDFRAGQYVANVMEIYNRPALAEELGLPRTCKYAFVFLVIDKNIEFFETVFVNRGFCFKVFDNYDKALKWLQ